MAQSYVLSGANIIVYINNKAYSEVQSISLDVDYSETEIYGIDSPYPQEIAGGKTTVRGSISGIRVKYSGGLQAKKMRPLFQDSAASPYISIRINDRSTGEDIVLIAEAKVTREKHSVSVKGTYKLSFDFVGMIPYFALDRS